MTQNEDLTRLAREGQLESLEAAWLEALEDPGPAAGFLEALEVLPREHRSAAMPLLLLLLEAYQQRDRHEDVIPIVTALLPFGPRNVDLKETAAKALMGQYGDEEWIDPFLELAGIEEALDLADALDTFERLRGLLPGRVVYHASGWGEGLVESADIADQSFTVRFRADGISRNMPFSTGLDVLKSLGSNDLRTRLLTDAEGLQADAAERPAVLVRAVARLHKGRCTSKEVKSWLADTVVPSRSWASWWKKAKAAAVHDPWLSVDNPSRPVFVLRKKALSATEELAGALDRAADLAEVLDVVRGPLGHELEEDVRRLILDHLGKAYDGAAIARPAVRFEAMLLLLKHGERELADLASLLEELLGRNQRFVDLTAPLSTPVRKEALEAFIKARPELWSDTIVNELSELPAPVLDLAAERLVEAGRGPALANRLHIYLLSPSRQPTATLRLARAFGKGLFDEVEGAPEQTEVTMGVLHLAETQAPKAARQDKTAMAVMKGVVEVLLGKRAGLLEPFCREAPRTVLEQAVGLLDRCRTMPDEVAGTTHRLVEERFPGLVPREEIPFWESGGIYCSEAGLRRRRDEYRTLMEEKIPENQAAIGKAASYGDLSENFEWTAAIEQQRQLTEKAAAMEAELRLAQSIEDQELPPGVVAPGTRVVYAEGGIRKEIRILGPWDVGEGIVSYRAPVAAGMLGAKAGDTVTLELPSGDVEVTIESVDPVES